MTHPFPEYETYDAVGLAELVAAKDIKPSELFEAAVSRIDEVNPLINAVVSTRFEAAAAELDDRAELEPFGGVPYLIKDLAPEEGEPIAFGSVFFKDYVGETTPEAVTRMKRAGLVSLGRTNTPEFGLLPTTEPVAYGVCRNPWDLSRSSGGSSGGAAAAVAAGIVPMANASDGGGSIRIPASACGVFGMKPTRGRIPLYPPGAADYLSTSFCVSKSVRDSAQLLDAISGHVPGSRYVASAPTTPYREEVETDPQPMRIAVTTTSLGGRPLHKECIAAVTATADLLVDLGHDVEEALPPIAEETISESFLTWWMSMAQTAALLILDEVETRPGGTGLRRSAGDYRALRAAAWLDRKRRSGLPAFEPFTWEMMRRAMQLTPGHLLNATNDLQEASYAMGSFLESYDIFISPTLGEPPKYLGEFDQTKTFDEFAAELVEYVPFTPIGNFSGLPAMSVPLHWTDSGLPVGVHFMGRHGDESMLFRLAGQLERAQPWSERRPPMLDHSLDR